MVGDFDPVAVEAKIKARVADWRGRGPAGADPDIGAIDYDRAPAAAEFVDPAVSDLVAIASFQPWVAQPDTTAKRARNLAEQVGEAIVSRRLARIAPDEDLPLLSGSLSEAAGWTVFDQGTVSALAQQA